MRIVTLNIRHGGGRRIDVLADALVSHAADTLVISEFRANESGQRLRLRLADAGYAHWADGAPPRTANSVAIASRSPVERRPLPLSSANRHRVVEVGLDGLTLGAVYFPLNTDKVAFWQTEFLPLAAARIAQPYVFIGDWNTGAHYIDEEAATFFAAQEFAAMTASGWTDAWRAIHPGGREYSWFSNRGHGFRLDHAFLSPWVSPRLRAATFSQAERLAQLTDHAALVVDLAEPPATDGSPEELVHDRRAR